jgi:hypothetical protein
MADAPIGAMTVAAFSSSGMLLGSLHGCMIRSGEMRNVTKNESWSRDGEAHTRFRGNSGDFWAVTRVVGVGECVGAKMRPLVKDVTLLI